MIRTFWRHNYQAPLWALFILVLCGIPGNQFEKSEVPHIDLAIHAFLFGMLSFLIATGFIKQSFKKSLRVAALRKAFLISVVYGIFIELLQGTIFTGRSIDAMDMVFNAVGAACGLAVFAIIYGRKPYW